MSAVRIDADGEVVGTMTDEEAEGCDYVVTMRVADLAPIETLAGPLRELSVIVRERSDIEQCCACGADVIVDNTTVPRKPPRICVPCMTDLANGKLQ